MLREALQFLQSSFHNEVAPQSLRKDELTETFYVPAWERTHTIDLQKERGRAHNFVTLEGFLSYLNSEHTAEDKGIIFIGRQRVHVRFDYERRVLPAAPDHFANLAIEETDAFKAFKVLEKGLSQKSVWQLIATKLDGCVDDSLLMALRSVQVRNESKVEWNIDELGAGSGTVGGGFAITTGKGDGSSAGAKFREEYIFSIQPWRCFDRVYEMKTRLTVDNDEGLKFFFHPARLEDVLDQAANDFAEAIRQGLSDETKKRFTVHEGTYAGNS